MNNILQSFLIFIGVIIIIIIISEIFIHNKSLEQEMKIYDIHTPMNYCPDGCNRGICNKDSKKCKYDFQCQYCKDKTTNMFYVNIK